jgi:epsilon-lactone hydrolase
MPRVANSFCGRHPSSSTSPPFRKHTTIVDAAFPPSSLLDEYNRSAIEHVGELRREFATALGGWPPAEDSERTVMKELRRAHASAVYTTRAYKRMRQLYPVNVTTQELEGVSTEVFTPVEDIATRNKQRVLINLHGGAFRIGSRTLSHIESIPIASTGSIKVVSVDYRMAPEHRFPAGSEDAAAVYRRLLDDYPPENIGIFGCSAGAMLTAQTIALLQHARLPPPGAIGMLCGAASYWTKGDSGCLASMAGIFSGSPECDPYLRGVDPSDPAAFPVQSADVLRRFPPSLLVSATRDLALSSVVHTHERLVNEGVKAELHVIEGLEHAFHYYPDLPQSHHVYKLLVRFFDFHLGQ